MGSTGAPPQACLVIPCFQERGRLDIDAVASLVDDTTSLLLVDDGSTDGTFGVLEELAASHERIDVLRLESNVGKGEAVRSGMRRCLESGGREWVGYVDADMATPATEVRRLLSLARESADIDVLIGARIAMLGRTVQRSPFRHYAGRVFATGASLVLAKPVYDTQCGTKLFRVGPALASALGTPFRSRWAFDVELLGRLAIDGVGAERFHEEPLREWRDAPGSKRGLAPSVRATIDLVNIHRDLRRRGRP